MPKLSPPAEQIVRLKQRLAQERAARLVAEAEGRELRSANRRLRALVLAAAVAAAAGSASPNLQETSSGRASRRAAGEVRNTLSYHIDLSAGYLTG
jgi:hypothetical protein